MRWQCPHCGQVATVPNDTPVVHCRCLAVDEEPRLHSTPDPERKATQHIQYIDQNADCCLHE